MTAPAIELDDRLSPMDYACSACSAIMQSWLEIDKHAQHQGCGGDVRVRPDRPHAPATPPLATRIEPLVEVEIETRPTKPPTPHALWKQANAEASTSAEATRHRYSELMREHGYIVPQRRKMPLERKSVTRTFRLASDGQAIEFEFIVGMFDDGSVGEIFIHADRQGAMLSGFLDATGIMISMLIQYGVPLPKIIRKLKGMRFPPEGRVTLQKGGQSTHALSPLDLLARWLETFVPKETP